MTRFQTQDGLFSPPATWSTRPSPPRRKRRNTKKWFSVDGRTFSLDVSSLSSSWLAVVFGGVAREDVRSRRLRSPSMMTSTTFFRRISPDRNRWRSLRRKSSRISHLKVAQPISEPSTLNNQPAPMLLMMHGVQGTVHNQNGKMIHSRIIPRQICRLVAISCVTDPVLCSMLHIHLTNFKAGTFSHSFAVNATTFDLCKGLLPLFKNYNLALGFIRRHLLCILFSTPWISLADSYYILYFWHDCVYK